MRTLSARRASFSIHWITLRDSPSALSLEIAAEIADDTDQPVTGTTQAIDEVRALSKPLDEIDSHRVLDDEWHTRRPRAV